MNKVRAFRIVVILTIVIGFTLGCKMLKKGDNETINFETKLTVFQNDIEFPVTKSLETIEIERKEFSLRFYNKRYDSLSDKRYVAQIAAFIDKSDFDKLRTGDVVSSFSFFEPGSGMAANRSGRYDYLILKNNAHHYVFYENSESKRLNLLKDSTGQLRLEFEVKSMYYNEKKFKMEEIELSEFYIAFFIDKNMNGVIDIGELNRLAFKVK